MKVGFGYDSHRLVKGRKLILGGQEIPFEKGLAGHSDADCLVHALCDAILGAMPKRQAQSFEDMMRRSGPVPLSRIEQTRQEIMATVKGLADAGEIEVQLFAETVVE